MHPRGNLELCHSFPAPSGQRWFMALVGSLAVVLAGGAFALTFGTSNRGLREARGATVVYSPAALLTVVRFTVLRRQWVLWSRDNYTRIKYLLRLFFSCKMASS